MRFTLEQKKNKYVHVLAFVLIIAVICTMLSACGSVQTSVINSDVSKDEEIVDFVAEVAADTIDEAEIVTAKSENDDGATEDIAEAKTYTEADMIDIDIEDSFSYCNSPICQIEDGKDQVRCSLDFAEGIPKSDDEKVYLFEIATFEDEDLTEKRPVAAGDKGWTVNIDFAYKERYLFARFVPALKVNGEYVAIAKGQYITNPEALAGNMTPYPQIDSKKGLLLDANTLGREQLTDLKVKRLVFNIPLSYIMGESESEECPTIEYKYNGKTYLYNGYRCAGFDSMFKRLTDEGYYCTAIVLNDWNKNFPEMIHPKSKPRTGRSKYYAFNTEEEEGVRLMEATALFLADRYNGGEYGMVYDWVIANEINQQTIWNYMNTGDLYYYTESFEKSFRTFYNAIKSRYGNAGVCFSIDHDWNNNGGNNYRFFNGKELLSVFNEMAKSGGNYDWGLSIHPYPAPLTKTSFWKGEYDKTEDAKVVTPMNLSSLTSFMKNEEFLDTKGKIRDISITELGFSSRSGEKLQAAAFAYCYYIIDNNEYISSFLLNRQTDDTESLRSGLALGIYNNDYSPKYIAEVFTNIDSKAGDKYIPEMLEIIGAESFEEALKRAE